MIAAHWHRATHVQPGYNRSYTMRMKTAISLPDPLFHSAERLAARLGVTRSELYRRALSDLIARCDEDAVTRRLDEIYSGDSSMSRLDPGLASLQTRAVVGRRRR